MNNKQHYSELQLAYVSKQRNLLIIYFILTVQWYRQPENIITEHKCNSIDCSSSESQRVYLLLFINFRPSSLFNHSNFINFISAHVLHGYNHIRLLIPQKINSIIVSLLITLDQRNSLLKHFGANQFTFCIFSLYRLFLRLDFFGIGKQDIDMFGAIF